MRPAENYKRIATLSDYHSSLGSKANLVRMIRKYLRDNDGSEPEAARLKRLPRGVLFMIWKKERPADLWEEVRPKTDY